MAAAGGGVRREARSAGGLAAAGRLLRCLVLALSAGGVRGEGHDLQPWEKGEYDLFGDAAGFRYDGHGALSAGATGRLLYDYPEPQRGEILDFLFKPKFGASLHMLKVEIGGDSQSGYGVEPSHMHTKSDMTCKRGSTFWLLSQARRRNPDILIYALTWAVPGWVGGEPWQDGLFSRDGIDYLLAWLDCCKRYGIGINYLGHRSARPWGAPRDGGHAAPTGNWTVALRSALDDGGFAGTRLVLPDNAWDDQVFAVTEENPEFAEAFDVIGIHYPCFLPKPGVHRAGYSFWSTEDGDVPTHWIGAGCIGKLLNQNFVWQNMTSTVIRSLVWSVYRDLSEKGSNALIDAFEPWSGRYTLNPSLWIMAHTTQFTEVGWRLLGASPVRPGVPGTSDSLTFGGTYVTYVSPLQDHFTVVIEKLHGKCTFCPGSSLTREETLTFTLKGWLNACLSEDRRLHFWLTNESHHFIQLPDLVVDAYDRFVFTAVPDTIYTVSTTTGQSRGSGSMDFRGPHSANTSLIWMPSPANSTGVDAAGSLSEQANATVNGTGNRSYHEPVGCHFNSSNNSAPCANATNISGDQRPEGVEAAVAAHEPFEPIIQPGHVARGSTFPGHVTPAGVFFPLPVFEDFETYDVDETTRFLADYAGSWQVAVDPTRPSNLVLKQWVSQKSGKNQWVPEAEPLAFAGFSMQDVAVSAVMYIPHSSAPLPISSGRGPALGTVQSPWSGRCLGTVSGGSSRGTAIEQTQCSIDRNGRFRYDPTAGSLAAMPNPSWSAFAASPFAPSEVSESSVGTPGTGAPVRRGRDLLVKTPSVIPGAPVYETKLSGVSLCLTGLGCPEKASARSDLCLLECGALAEPQRSGQAWDFYDDGTLRLRSRDSLCVTALGSDSSHYQGAPLRLMTCGSQEVEYRQKWLMTSIDFVMHTAVCARLQPPHPGMTGRESTRHGYCLTLGVDRHNNGRWHLEKSGTSVLAQGPVTNLLGVWHSALLEVNGSRLRAMVDGETVARENDADYGSGMVGISSGWSVAYFDDFAVEPTRGEAFWEIGGAPGRSTLEPRRRRWPAGFGWPP